MSSGPGGRAIGQLGFDGVVEIGALGQERAVGETFGEHDVHHRAREGVVGPRQDGKVKIGLLGRRAQVRVDHHQLGPLAPSLGDPGHDVDLGVDRVHAPNHDEIAVGHVARVGPEPSSDARLQPGLHDAGADGLAHPGVAHAPNQPLDAVALHQPHRPRVVIRPHRLWTVGPGRVREPLRDEVEGFIPRCAPEMAFTLGAGSHQRVEQSIRVVDPFLVAPDLRADHAVGVRHLLCPAQPDQATVVDLDVEGAGAGTIVRTHGAGYGHG